MQEGGWERKLRGREKITRKGWGKERGKNEEKNKKKNELKDKEQDHAWDEHVGALTEKKLMQGNKRPTFRYKNKINFRSD